MTNMTFNSVYTYLLNGNFGFETYANARTSFSTLSSLPGYDCDMLYGGGYGSTSTTVLFDRFYYTMP